MSEYRDWNHPGYTLQYYKLVQLILKMPWQVKASMFRWIKGKDVAAINKLYRQVIGDE